MNNIKDSDIQYLKKYVEDKNLDDKFYNDCLDKMSSGIPVQYAIGNVDFYGNIINVDERVLIPRFETELLVEKTIGYIKKLFNRNINVLDIGTGSGCISITLKKLLDCDITGVDISDDALSLARENALNNSVDINFLKSDIFSSINDKYDVIISNPPYISYDEDIMDVVKNNEPHLALYANDNGLYFYDKILSLCSNYLNNKFLIAFEIGYMQGDAIRDLAFRYLNDVKISIEKDYNDKDRYVFIWNN